MLDKAFGAAGDEVVIEELYVFSTRVVAVAALLLVLQATSYTQCLSKSENANLKL